MSTRLDRSTHRWHWRLAASFVLASLMLVAHANAPQRLIDYAASIGSHPEDARMPNVGEPRFGGVLNFAEAETIGSIDSHRTGARVATQVNVVFAEGLFAFNSVGASAPQLVASYEVSDDELTYTFTLREGVPFHNGDVLDADDVVASLQRWFGGTLGSQAQRFVSDVRAEGPLTVVLEVTEPYPFIIYQLTVPQTAGAFIYPASQIEAAGDEDIQEPYGTGPYRVTDLRDGQFIRMDRFDDYVGRDERPDGFAGGRVPYLDAIVIHAIPDSAVRAAGVDTNQFQVARVITPDLFPVYDLNPNVRTRVDSGSFTTVQFNKRQGVMTNPLIREAFNLAIDTAAVVAAAGPPEFNSLNSSLAPVGDPWHTTVGEDIYLAYDPERARALLEEAGYEGQAIRWLYDPNTPQHMTPALVARPMLEAVGFVIELMPVDAATLRTTRNEAERYEVYAQALGWRPDPAALTNLSDGNPGWWVTEEKTRILTAMRIAQDFDERYRLWEELHAHMYDYLPAIKFETYGTLDLEREEYSGFFRAWSYYNLVTTWLN